MNFWGALRGVMIGLTTQASIAIIFNHTFTINPLIYLTAGIIGAGIGFILP